MKNKKTTKEIYPRMKDYQVIASFLSNKGSKRDWNCTAFHLKNCGNTELIVSSTDRIRHTLPYIDRAIWGNALPDSIRTLGNGDNSFFFKPESLDNEINWVITGLRRYAAQLTDYVKMRSEVERHIMLGNYDDALAILDASLKKIGHTVWYYEMRLLIYGYQENLDKCCMLLTTVNQEKKKDKVGFISELLTFLCNRSLGNFSPFEYDSLLYSRYKKNRTEFQNDRYNYFLFRLNYYQHYDIDDLSVTLIMESLNSAVDRYTLLLYVLRSYMIQETASASVIVRFARRLYRLTHDSLLFPFLAIDPAGQLPDEYFDEPYIHILDRYYVGDFETTARLCHDYLLAKPFSFEVVELYCRALISMRKGFRFISRNDDSLLNQIVRNVYLVMTEKDNDQYIDQLYRLNKHIYGMLMAAGLDLFIRCERNIGRCETISLLSQSIFTPQFCQIFKEGADRQRYLEEGLRRMPDSISLKYQLNRERRVVTEDETVIPLIRNIDNASILFDNGKFEESLELWKQILSENKDITPNAQTAVEYIFRCYLSMGTEYRQQAVRFYISQYLFNKAFVSKVETSTFMKEIKQSRYEGLKNDIDFLIFVFLNAENYPQKQFVLESYCRYENVRYPSELIEVFAGKPSSKVELFFSLLLTEDILYHHYKLKSTVDVLEEKLKIVIFLRKQYPDNKQYDEKYTELMHELIAYRGMKKLDDSKIYVNEDAVLKYELQDINDLYDRFKKQAALVRENRVCLLVDLNWNDPKSLGETISNAAHYSDNAASEAANQLFDVIRRAFLKSRFGLGTYLSTRIRHGVFEGELRTGLARLDLVYHTSGSSYVPSNYWKSEFSLDETTNTQLNKCIERFSQQIDSLIAGFKDGVIQIHVDDNDTVKGCFDYAIPSEKVTERFLQLETKTNDANEFCQQVIGYLWEITEQRLATIRQKVHEELRPQIFQYLEQLETAVNAFSSFRELHKELTSKINNAREDLTNKLTKVENWFYRQETKFENFALDDYIRMAFESVGKYMPNVNSRMAITPPRTILQIRSEYSASMFDLLSIFFSNMLQYSRVERERTFIIHTDIVEGNYQLIHMENLLPEDTDEDALNRLFKERLGDECCLQKEGGSGLVKAMNIVKYDFGDKSNTFTIEARDGKCVIDILFNLNDMTAPVTPILN